MSLVRRPVAPSPALMEEIRPRPVGRIRVVGAMLVAGLVGPLVGLAISGQWRDRGLAALVAYDVVLAVIATALALRRPRVASWGGS